MNEHTKLFVCLMALFSHTTACASESKTAIPNTTNKDTISNGKQIVKRHLDPLYQIIRTKILNTKYKQLALEQTSLVEILKKEQSWSVSASFRSEILDNSLADHFKQIVDDSKLQFTELMFTNNMGELISAYPKTTDYWQGDEEKFTNPVINRELYVSLPAWDQSTEYYSIHLSIPIIEDNQIYGVIIAGLDVTPEDLLSLDLQELLKLKVQVRPK
ncbi:MAG: PDC sensor domain-containing protein [Kangiellaceae bacterium]|nr:PDC sensor domain-containing protein [Kangiellaceae bacterium]MCW8999281.1 PDC sensor domain-containing protein [Kangiellaceae bacterium]